MSEDRDYLIDSALEETLGGIQPPDLSQRILLAVREASDDPASPRAVDLTNPAAPLPHGSLDIQPTPAPRRRSSWMSAAWTLGVLTAGVLIGLFALQFSKPSDVAQENGSQANDSSSVSTRVTNTPRRNGTDVRPDRSAEQEREYGLPPEDSHREGVPFRPSDPSRRMARLWEPPEVGEVQPVTTMVSTLDRHLQQQWEREDWQPGSPVSDEEWMARVLDRVFGVLPEDVPPYITAALDRQVSRGEILDQWFADDRLRKQYARKWANVWTDHLMLMASERDTDQHRQRLSAFLRGAITRDVPLARWPERLLAAEGTVEESRGAGTWLLAHSDRENLQITAAVGEVFLGQRIACVRCHGSRPDQPADVTADEMSDFWQLNAFFAQLRAERDGDQVRLVDRDMQEDVIYFELPGGFQKAVLPVFPDGQSIASSGNVASVVRRRELADWIGSSTLWHRVVVQRVWRTLLQSPLEGESSVTEALVSQSAAHAGSLATLTRWIVLSEAFGRASHPADHRLAGGVIGMYRADGQLKASRDLLRVAESNDGNSILLARAFDNSEPGVIAVAPIATIPLLPSRAAFVDQIVDSKLRWKEQVDHLFLHAIGRLPRSAERRIIAAIHQKQPDNRQALKTIMEALCNSADSDNLLK